MSHTKLNLILYSQTNAQTIAQAAGMPEYSYYSILKEYLPLLESLGTIHYVYDPKNEVDTIYQDRLQHGECSLFLHFSAPQNYIPGIECPTIHVLAWEYSTIPSESWNNCGFEDWRFAFERCIGAITISQYTVDVIKDLMGDDYPVVSIPCPVWDRFNEYRQKLKNSEPLGKCAIHFEGVLIDSNNMDLFTVVPTEEEVEAEKRKGDQEMLELKSTQERLTLKELELGHREAKLYQTMAEEWHHLEGKIAEETERIARKESQLNLQISAAANRMLEEARAQWTALAEDINKGHAALDAQDNRFLDWLRVKQSEFNVEEDKPAWEQVARVETHVNSARQLAAAKSAEMAQIDRDLEAEAAAAKAAEEAVNSDSIVPTAVYLEGCIYTAILNPYDLRKNWRDMVVAFCWAFKEVSDATLLIKLTASHVVTFADELVMHLKGVAPFKCRVVAIHAFLDNKSYLELLSASTYYVNTSYGEGQSIPLTEAMSCGIPAVSSNHTAMQEYVFDHSAFIFKSNPEVTYWQHDPRKALRCLRYRPDWLSLVDAYKRSYHVAKNEPNEFKRLGEHAIADLEKHCSVASTKDKLTQFVHSLASAT